MPAFVMPGETVRSFDRERENREDWPETKAVPPSRFDESGKIFDFPLDRVWPGIATFAAPPTIIGDDGKMGRKLCGQGPAKAQIADNRAHHPPG